MQSLNILSPSTINQSIFTVIKNIADGLKHEVAYDKAHGYNINNDFNFSDFNDPNVSGNSIAQAINDFGVITPATNLTVVMNSDKVLIAYADTNSPYDESLNVEDVLNTIERLIKLGHHGIGVRLMHNQTRRKQIVELNRELDL